VTLLGGMTPRRFLREHWQRRFLLLRGALPGFRDPVAFRDLARLSCRPEVESRLVLARGGARPFELFEGPQQPRRLARLPARNWTLLVQGVDQYVPAVARLLEAVPFIPRWRLDDVMISFATPGGSVGPHVDNYDVFLVQGRGRRRWGLSAGGSRQLRAGLDLRVLRRFEAEHEWVLEPGDVLYVPPGVAHHGVALSDCLTYSIGFRAPSETAVLASLLQRLVENAPREQLYSDRSLPLQSEPGEITAWALRRFGRIAAGALNEPGALEVALGELLTMSKRESIAARKPLPLAELRDRLRRGDGLAVAPGSRLAFARRGASTLLFADGRSFELPRVLGFAGPLLTRAAFLSAQELRPHLADRRFVALVQELIGSGVLSLACPPATA
jgi:50S ribosomal protein L16 3-hydroxylase